VGARHGRERERADENRAGQQPAQRSLTPHGTSPDESRRAPSQARPYWGETYSMGNRDAPSGAGEAPARRGRVGLVEAQRGVDGVRVGAGLLGLELREALGGELARVLLLDALEPRGAFGLLGGVDVDLL